MLRSRAEIKPLTSLRFIAALLVFLYHIPDASFAREHALGQAGVAFFFVLSGFILTYTYADRLDVRSYCVARFARIYPVYLVSIVAAIAVLIPFGGEFWNVSDRNTRIVAAIAQLFAVQAWFPQENIYLGINSPSWSISVEAFLYALFPLLLASLIRSFRSVPAGKVLAVASLTWACVVPIFLMERNVAVWTTYILPPVRVVDFLVGMLLGVAFVRGYKVYAATAFEFGTMAAAGFGIIAIPFIPAGLQYSIWMLPFWASLIVVVAPRQGLISFWLSHPIPVRLGEISFAFYLLHVSIIIVAQHIAPSATWPVALILTLTAAWTLNVFVERPMRIMIRSKFAPKAAQHRYSNALSQKVV